MHSYSGMFLSCASSKIQSLKERKKIMFLTAKVAKMESINERKSKGSKIGNHTHRYCAIF